MFVFVSSLVLNYVLVLVLVIPHKILKHLLVKPPS
jgi:hypothetical protein